MSRRRSPDDRGMVVVFFAICVTALLAVAGMVLGSSVGYTAVRNVQNAVDAGALAGAAELYDVRRGLGEAADVEETAVSLVVANGGAPGAVRCEVVAAEYALGRSEADVIGPCTEENVLADRAVGVRVTAAESRAVPFDAFVRQETITASARAAATVQPVRTVNAPFMLCSAPSATGHPALPLVADPATGAWSINADAIGKSYVVYGIEVGADGRDCGANSSNWRGLIPPEQDLLVPPASDVDDRDWIRIDDGNATGTLETHLDGAHACEGDVSTFQQGCRISLPLCPRGNGLTGTNFRLYCVKMGVFVITWSRPSGSIGPAPCHPKPQGNSTICATFVVGGRATTGLGSAVTFDPEEVVVIKLVE